MNENTPSPTKWLQYMLYVGIASAALTILSIFLPANLTHWIGIAANGVLTYLMFRLAPSNARYKKAGIFYAVSLGVTILGVRILGLVGDICAIVAQYQEYHAHGELIAERNPKQAEKWGSLFWLQFALSIVIVLLAGLIAGILAAVVQLDEAAVVTVTTVLIAAFGLGLKVLYLVYLKRTIQALESESPV